MKPLFIKQSAHNSPSDLLGKLTMKVWVLLFLTALFLAGCQVVPEPKHNFLAANPIPVGADLAGVWVGITPNIYTQENFIINANGTGSYCMDMGSNSGVSDLKIIRENGTYWVLFPSGEYEVANGPSSNQKIFKNSIMLAKDLTVTKAKPSDISAHCRKLFDDLQ